MVGCGIESWTWSSNVAWTGAVVCVLAGGGNILIFGIEGQTRNVATVAASLAELLGD